MEIWNGKKCNSLVFQLEGSEDDNKAVNGV